MELYSSEDVEARPTNSEELGRSGDGDNKGSKKEIIMGVEEVEDRPRNNNDLVRGGNGIIDSVEPVGVHSLPGD